MSEEKENPYQNEIKIDVPTVIEATTGGHRYTITIANGVIGVSAAASIIVAPRSNGGVVVKVGRIEE